MQKFRLNNISTYERSLILSFGLLIALIPTISQAIEGITERDLLSKEMTEEELRLLPKYCADTQSFPQNYQAKRGYWVRIMGPDFQHMHHYCRGLNKASRAQKTNLPQRLRAQLWNDAANEYQYMVTNATSDFVLLPEIYTRIGEVELRRHHPEGASRAFLRARELKPDYWPAYSRWADYLMMRGKREEALKVVRAGLEHTPNAKSLLDLYRLLGGKASDIPLKPADRSRVDIAPPVGNTPTETHQDKFDKDGQRDQESPTQELTIQSDPKPELP